MRRRRLASIVGAALLGAGLACVSAGASGSAGRPPGSPDLAAMSLAVSDFPTGARVIRQRYVRDRDFVASYERDFSLGGSRVGRSRILFAFTALDVGRTSLQASTTFSTIVALMKQKGFRDAFAREIARGAEIDAKSVSVGRPRTSRIGDGALAVAVTLRGQGVSLRLAITFVRVDRVLGSVLLLGMPRARIFDADADRLARVAAERMRAGLVPAVTAAPIVSGILNPGQTLSATTGTWTGDQIMFGYQWERCTGSATGCSPIAGASASTYTLAPGDLASTVRVTVSGRNGLGSATASSPATGFVSGPPGAPVSTEAPVVEGVVGAGATLAATTGTWNGVPTAFAYQWRRCSPSTGACVDVAGATGSTHTLGPADSGSLLRVLVIATNEAGSGGAISGPTAPAP